MSSLRVVFIFLLSIFLTFERKKGQSSTFLYILVCELKPKGTLVVILTMGCDGGTIPTRDELVKTKKKPEQVRIL